MSSTDVVPVATPCQSRKRRILCVDDDGAILDALRRLFRNEPYEIFTALKASHALAFLRQHPVDVIISDERMPGMNGSEFLGEVSQHWPGIRRVILTAYPGHPVMSESFRAGVDYLFYKPWDDQSLRTAVHRLIWPEQKSADEALEPPGKGMDLGGEAG